MTSRLLKKMRQDLKDLQSFSEVFGNVRTTTANTGREHTPNAEKLEPNFHGVLGNSVYFHSLIDRGAAFYWQNHGHIITKDTFRAL